MSIFFLFRNHSSNSDFIFLFSHHNSICDAGLNTSRCLKAFPATLNTIPKNLFLLYYTIYINIYLTVFFRWCEVDGWVIRYDHRDVNHLQINSWSCAVAIVWKHCGTCFYLWKRIRWGVDSKLFQRCFFTSAISFCSTRLQHCAKSWGWKEHGLSSFCLWPSKLCTL